MGVCDDILKKDIVPSCDDPVVQGLEQEGVIMNRADVDFAATVFNSGVWLLPRAYSYSYRQR